MEERAHPKIVIRIEGGCLVDVYCSDAQADLMYFDFDNAKEQGTTAQEEAEYETETKGLAPIF